MDYGTKRKEMKPVLYNLSFKHEVPEDSIVINVTSYSDSFGRMLSPFNVGPVNLYDGYWAHNLENGYQFAKIYSQYSNDKGEPNDNYWKWAKAGWENKKPIKYPLGAWNECLHHWWKGRKLNRLEAQNEIFLPLYKDAVTNTKEFKRLKEIYETSNRNIVLLDFEGYDHNFLEIPLKDVFAHPDYPVGQGFALIGLLEGIL
jgi:hypothetical protein